MQNRMWSKLNLKKRLKKIMIKRNKGEVTVSLGKREEPSLQIQERMEG